MKNEPIFNRSKRFRFLGIFPALLLLAYVGSAASDGTTNIQAVVHGLKSVKTEASALSDLDEMVTKWSGTNYEIFSPAIDSLISMIGWGGIERKQSQKAEETLIKLHSISVPKLIEATKSPDVRLRVASAGILGAIRPVGNETVETLSLLTTDKDASVRRAAYGALIGFGGQFSNTVPLLRAATNDPDIYNRLMVCSGLVRMTGETIPFISIIVAGLTNENVWVRDSAALNLDSCGYLASNTYPQLVLALKDGDPQLRIYSAAALGQISAKNPEVIAALTAALESDDETEVKRSAAVSLGHMGLLASNSVPILIRILHRADADSKGNCTGWWVAAEALGGIRSDEALAGLREALKSGDPDIRLTAERELGLAKQR